jgi:predicted GIY-YIG superfamily endonuclease
MVIYLLHFDAARHHARHYLGSTDALEDRLRRHANAQGAKLTQALARDGEHWTLAAVFAPNATTTASLRTLERRAKRRHNGAEYCPICNQRNAVPPGTIQLPTPNMTSRNLPCKSEPQALISPTNSECSTIPRATERSK